MAAMPLLLSLNIKWIPAGPQGCGGCVLLRSICLGKPVLA
jgi:hypothetical protein